MRHGGVLFDSNSSHPRTSFCFRGSIVRAALRLRGGLSACMCSSWAIRLVVEVFYSSVGVGLSPSLDIYACFRNSA